jgi:two-component system response regulator AtoC
MPDQARILIVDDDPIVAESLADFLSREGFDTATACDGREALTMLDDASSKAGGGFGIIIADMNMPRCDGMELLKGVRKSHESVAPIVVTGFGKIESAVEAVRLGAVDYLTKPVVDDELRLAVNKAVNQHTLVHENKSLKTQLSERFGMGNLIGNNYRMQKVYDLVEAVAESKTTVLVTGETGTGKSMVGRAIHTTSPRSGGPFVTFACGSIPETLLESELFGHVKGAFTGADSDKAGKCLAADGGTLFIDEINSATPALQLKLLRVLQEKAFEPVGSTETIHVDVRFVLATNQSLSDMVDEGLFREDLYYRINVVNIAMPALRDRSGDVPDLAEHFLEMHCKELGRQRKFSSETLETLRAYSWPGNVRELENAIERAVVLSKGNEIQTADLTDQIIAATNPGLVPAGSPGSPGAANGLSLTGAGHAIPALADGWNPMPLSAALQEPERQIIIAALQANEWNRQETARQLDINRSTLYKKIKQYHLDEPGMAG